MFVALNNISKLVLFYFLPKLLFFYDSVTLDIIGMNIKKMMI